MTDQTMDRKIAGGMYVSLGEMVTILRHRRGWSQFELADEAGLSIATVTYMEVDAYEEITIGDVVIVGEALGVWLHISMSDKEVKLLNPQSRASENVEEDERDVGEGDE